MKISSLKSKSINDPVLKLLYQYWETLVKKRGHFSLRSLARIIEIHPAALSEMFNGKRAVTFKSAQKILSSIGIEDLEAQKILKDLSKRRRLNSKGKEVRQLTIDQIRLASEWHHYAILALADTDQFNFEENEIAQRFNLKPATVEASLRTLLGLGLIQKDKNNIYFKTGSNFEADLRIDDDILRTYHVQTLRLAESALDMFRTHERDFSSLTIASTPEKILKAKEKIKTFRRKLAIFLESGSEKTEVYRLAIQLFPISVKK